MLADLPQLAGGLISTQGAELLCSQLWELSGATARYDSPLSGCSRRMLVGSSSLLPYMVRSSRSQV